MTHLESSEATSASRVLSASCYSVSSSSSSSSKGRGVSRRAEKFRGGVVLAEVDGPGGARRDVPTEVDNGLP